MRSFPSIVRLHPHAATTATAAAVEARNLATVARYNRYCGRGLNGGELELRSNRPTDSDNSSRSHGGERPLTRYLNPCASCSVSLSRTTFHPCSVCRAYSLLPLTRRSRISLLPASAPYQRDGGGGGGGDDGSSGGDGAYASAATYTGRQ